MTASIKNVNRDYVTSEDYVEDQEIKLENEEQLNQLKETLEAKENEIRPEKGAG